MQKTLKLLLALSAAMLFSCQTENRNPLLPNISGAAGEVIVVMQKSLWEGGTGSEMRVRLAYDYGILPQEEPAFDLIFIPPDGFSNMFKLNRNIIIAKVKSTADSAMFAAKNDIWAKPQLVMEIIAPDTVSLTDFIKLNGPKMASLMEDAERNRIMASFKANQNKTISDQLQRNHHINLIVPSNFNIDVDSNNFVWMSHETPEISQSILIYHYPYEEGNSFTKSFLISKRNEICKAYVPGPNQGSYMGTERDELVDFNEFGYKGRYIAYLKGLWKLENGGFMGGAIYQYLYPGHNKKPSSYNRRFRLRPQKGKAQPDKAVRSHIAYF
ncbi:MAG: DUF4837 family protein [Bacteroidales bacterium]|nr:DUF4837 family protein [Bacteroidales bacterium]